MRPTSSVIYEAVAETFVKGINVRLFGSRVVDNKRDGDIDLLIETDLIAVDIIVRAKGMLMTQIQMRLGEQKIDVLLGYLFSKNRPPIFAIAKQAGILL